MLPCCCTPTLAVPLHFSQNLGPGFSESENTNTISRSIACSSVGLKRVGLKADSSQQSPAFVENAFTRFRD